MSDPRYTDPRLNEPPLGEPPLREEVRRQRPGELETSNVMWAWIAGGIVLALLLVFVLGRTPSSDTAMTVPPPGETTLSPPSSQATPPPVERSPAPGTTGQGGQ